MIGRSLFPLLVALLGGGFLWQATDGLSAITAEGARRVSIADNPRAVSEVYLQSMDASSIPLRPLADEIVLVEFIYTTCGDICQEAAFDFAEIRDQLEAFGAKVRMISLSFDPARDIPEQLAYYGEIHGARGELWTVARPREEDLSDLLELFGVTVIANEWGGYEHNTAIHLIDQQGRFAALYDIDEVDQVVDAVRERS